MSAISNAYNVKKGATGYKLELDIDANGIIDLYDMVRVSKKMGAKRIYFYSTYQQLNTGKKFIGEYKTLDEAKKVAEGLKNAYVLNENNKEVWRGRYECYVSRQLKGRFNTIDEAINSIQNYKGGIIKDVLNADKIVWRDGRIFGIVNASTLNVRSGAGTNYSVIGQLYSGNEVEIIDISNSGWYKIKYGQGFGYVSKSYILLKETTYIGKVVIDPGHGGSDPGAIGSSGLKEKDVVLSVSLKLKNILEKNGLEVVMTRDKDIYLTLEERVEISNNSNAQCFISVHANSFTDSSANGIETLVKDTNGIKGTLASTIQKNLVSNLGLRDRGGKVRDQLYVLRHNNIPAVLTELAFISNANEQKLLASEEFQTKAANAIAKSIMECSN